MDLKHITEKHATPKSEIGILGKPLSRRLVSESPFRTLPNFSTPPSRFSRILNPFESHLIERLHLPTFSPNVFLQNSTPRNEQRFKWTIDDISTLKPAEIDETTVSQHVMSEDPHTESLVQKRIDTFFSEKEIVPSPMNIKIENVPLIKDCDNSFIHDKEEETPVKELPRTAMTDGITQTLLTLPPVLPAELENVLKPYFQSEAPSEGGSSDAHDSLYRKLFHLEDRESFLLSGDNHSVVSSPAISSGLSPIQLSPGSGGIGSPFDIPELKDCNLSPICKTSSKLQVSKSVCRLNFSEMMSIDASLVVPDLDNDKDSSQSEEEFRSLRISSQGKFIDTSANWSMEYKQISIDSQCSGTDVNNMMDISNSNTPHSKLYIGKGQRKRLSESFKEEELDKNPVNDNAICYEDLLLKNRSKVFKNDQTDVGYCTEETGDFSSNSQPHVFASTPSKRQYNLHI